MVIATHGFMKKTQKTPPKEIAKAEQIRIKYFSEKTVEMKTYTHEEMLDRAMGKKCTPRRDELETKLDNYLIGEAIKQTRIKQNMTQKQLGELIGVQEAQVSKIESGKSITYATIVKVFKALGAKAATLDLGGLGRVALW